jgi:hypothetical protein
MTANDIHICSGEIHFEIKYMTDESCKLFLPQSKPWELVMNGCMLMFQLPLIAFIIVSLVDIW